MTPLDATVPHRPLHARANTAVNVLHTSAALLQQAGRDVGAPPDSSCCGINYVITVQALLQVRT